MLWFRKCRTVQPYANDDEVFCLTHGCSVYVQCGKLSCIHCVWKSDAKEGVFGYPIDLEGNITDKKNYERPIRVRAKYKGSEDAALERPTLDCC